MESESVCQSERTSRSAPLRILFVVDGLYPATSGCEMQVRLLTRAFADAGHSVQVLAPQLDRTRSLTERVDDIALTRIGYPQIRLFGAAVLCAKYGFWVWRRRRDFDAVHVHMAKNLAAVSGIIRPLIPATVAVKISGAWEFDGGILDPTLRGRPLNRLYNWCIKRVDKLQCISKFTHGRLRDAGYPDRQLVMIPNAVDLRRFSPAAPRARAPNTPVRVVYVGRLRPVKGVAVLLEAWSKLVRETPAQLVLAGYGSSREALEKTARDQGFADSVEFLGEVSDVPSVLASADIYVQPSFQEGLPNSVLEAMAMGLPIVATRISGNEDVVTDGENGFLVPPGDAGALAAALRRLMGDLPLAARMGHRSREIVEERFALKAILGQLERTYRGAPDASSAT